MGKKIQGGKWEKMGKEKGSKGKKYGLMHLPPIPFYLGPTALVTKKIKIFNFSQPFGNPLYTPLNRQKNFPFGRKIST